MTADRARGTERRTPTRAESAGQRARNAREPLPEEGRLRAVIDRVEPEIDGGRFPAKRVVGDVVEVRADVFADGHDALSATLLWREEGAGAWNRTEMEPEANDVWLGSFRASRVGRYEFTVEARVDAFLSWQRDLEKRIAAGQEVLVELEIGAALVAEAAERASGSDSLELRARARDLSAEGGLAPGARAGIALGAALRALVEHHPDRRFVSTWPRALPLRVDPPRAGFSAWYEFFPRSCAGLDRRHGNFSDCVARLDYVASLGFDVVYLPPIHPIGSAFRKGRDNAVSAEPGDVGSPWAIGSAEGGHEAVHPELGTLEDFDRFVAEASRRGLAVALDVAFQCSPDHPWVREHPQWFRRRPDGTIQYAENPPKKYQDIYPFDFETDDWRALWLALRDVFEFWIGHGVTIFRVDNPHTKAFAFWEWVIADLQQGSPEVLFLSEAFTRPKPMYRLAKLGFTWSYTYFAWRNTKWEIERYFTELVEGEPREFFRPHLWPNTPDILTEFLQAGGPPAFALRVVLAATLGANYGIYGPAYELCLGRALAPGREDYADSEKYELRTWDLAAGSSLGGLIERLNRIRRDNPALQRDRHLRFHRTDSDQVIAYSKRTDDRSNVVLVVLNLDPHHAHHAHTDLDLEELGVSPGETFQVDDLLSGARYQWTGPRNYVELAPLSMPAHVLRVRRRVRTEQDFDYFL